jgi:hypothetical protein
MARTVVSIHIGGIIRNSPPFGWMAGIRPRRIRNLKTVGSGRCWYSTRSAGVFVRLKT